ALLDDADVVLQPYQADVYQAGTSAIFEEAMYLGRPCVVPPRTMMATALGGHPYAGAVAVKPSAEALAGAVIDVLSDYPRYAAGAAYHRLSLAGILTALARFAEAAAELRRLLTGEPENVEALLALAGALRPGAGPLAAATWAGRTLAVKSDYAEAAYNRGNWL